MENQNQNESVPVSSDNAAPSGGVSIWVAVVIGALSLIIGGLGTYLVTATVLQSRADNDLATAMRESDDVADTRLMEARDQISTLETRVVELENGCAEQTCPLDDVDFPITVYQRPGLLTSSEEGRAEMAEIERRLIEPMALYHNEEEPNLLTVDVEIPAEVGEAYIVSAINSNGVREGFIYSERGGDIDWWAPICGIEPCEFSEAFREAYPEIVAAAE